MQFLVMGYDGKDEGARQRRMDARPLHIELGNKMVAEGRHLVGVAMLDDAGEMIGSTLIVDFPDRNALDAWLSEEPYVTGKVWQRVDIMPCRVGPSFMHILPKKP